jgi:hypothetical protein
MVKSVPPKNLRGPDTARPGTAATCFLDSSVAAAMLASSSVLVRGFLEAAALAMGFLLRISDGNSNLSVRNRDSAD